MTLGEKLSKLRKENNYTQEQLAELLGVSRQSVSKWESDLAYPETEKLIVLGRLFDCSMDYLLKEDVTEKNGASQKADKMEEMREGMKLSFAFCREVFLRERKSEKLVCGMPLYHVGRDAHGFFAVGLRAKGVFAVGLFARGAVSLGLLSLGILSFGVLSLGLIALGCFALGLLAVGAISLGLLAVGAIAVGLVSFGALSVGCFSSGALAIGKYVAVGDHARAWIAIGESEATGEAFRHFGTLPLPKELLDQIRLLLDERVPAWLGLAKKLFWIYLC